VKPLGWLEPWGRWGGSKMIEAIRKDFQELRARSMVDGELWRASYTEEMYNSVTYLKDRMVSMGLIPVRDAIGNLYGTVEGAEDSSMILVGSHLDTVKNGGEYDGMYGVIAGMYAIHSLVEKHGQPRKRIAVVGMLEEEGSRFVRGYTGSKAIVGELNDEDLQDTDASGLSLKEAMEGAGYDSDKIHRARRRDIEAFYEIHIEQGPVLENGFLDIGLVDAITGIKVVTVTIHGRQDHAGTTPMNMRQDAMLAASKIVSQMDVWTEEMPSPTTATVGTFVLKPGSANVVADYVSFTVDIRSADKTAIQGIMSRLEEALKAVNEMGMKTDLSILADEAPVTLDQTLLKENAQALEGLNMAYKQMGSGAGHDTQMIAPYVPASLLFVPCIGGRSHTPDEAMTDRSILKGVEALSEILYKKAWQ